MTIWKKIDWIENYEFSDDGRCRRTTASNRWPLGSELRGSVTQFGYRRWALRVGGKNRAFFANRLICEAFHGAPPFDGAHSAHFDGDKLNNRASNLRWATAVENAADRDRHGKTISGERHFNSKLTWPVVREIRKTYRYGKSSEIALRFGVTIHAVRMIVQNRAWKEIGGRVAHTRYLAAKNAAHHPESEAGRDIGPGEESALNRKAVCLKVAA